MNTRSTLLLAAGILAGALCSYYNVRSIRNLLTKSAVNPQRKDTVLNDCIAAYKRPDTPVRESITFILGEDKTNDNRYYEEASRYYANHPDGKTDYLVTTCRSLVEVHNYLEKKATANGLPWGLVNLVSHGNQWTGLSVKVAPDSKRSSAARIDEYIQSNTFLPLPKTKIDRKTEFFIHGCGVGNNEALVNNLAQVFRGEDCQPNVRASKLFEYYASVQHNNVIQSEHYLANSWMTCYPMNEKPLINTLCNTLHDQYPDTNIDWHQALQQASPRWIGDSYHYTFEVPVKWIVPVNSLPDVSTSEKQISWLVSQKQIVDELSGTNISIDRFSWSFTTVYVNSGEDSKSPALLIKGYCTVLCVLQALTQHHNRMLLLQKPFTPALDSKQYYYATDDL